MISGRERQDHRSRNHEATPSFVRVMKEDIEKSSLAVVLSGRSTKEGDRKIQESERQEIS